MTTPTLIVNGEQRAVAGVEPHVTALDWLRDRGLTGAKEGCAEGECGACSVMVARPDATGGRTRWTAINACLVPALALDGQEVVTAEGSAAPRPAPRAARDGRPRRVPVRLLHAGIHLQHGRGVLPARPGSGRVRRTNGHAARRTHEHGPNGFDLHALSGNLCRCTGYRPIRDAAYALGAPPGDDPLATRCAAPAPAAVATRVRSDDGPTFARPADLAEALQLLAEHPDAVARRRLHRLGRRGQPPRPPRPVRRRHRPAARAAHARPSGRTSSRSARRSPSPRSSAASTAACRCWPSCSRSSPPG